MFMVMSEYYQQLAPWLLEPINRTHRLFLENHIELLSPQYEQFLTRLINKYKDHPGERQELRMRQELSRDIRAYHEYRSQGHSHDVKESIRDAYVNKFGALLLDMPLN